jgi:hypothetical protein
VWRILFAMPLLAEPRVDRLYPLGGQRGTETEIELTGSGLINTRGAEFDTPDLAWVRIVEATPGRVRGIAAIGPRAAPGPHLVRLVGPDGLSNTMMFNVGTLPALRESEPNDSIQKAQPVPSTPVEIYGELASREESDFYSIQAKAGQRLVFDLRAIEYGSQLESKLHLLDSTGRRIATVDDRSDYDDGPCLEHRFAEAGRYYVQVDQFHGPRAADAKNNTYILRVSSLPNVHHVSRLGGRRGTTVRARLAGTGLDELDSVHIVRARRAEYYRLTYPTTMPVDIDADGGYSIPGRVVDKSPDHADIDFAIPPDAPVGIYRLWAGTDVSGFEIDDGDGIDSVLASPRARNRHAFQAKVGEPLHVYLHAAQLGGPSLDSVLDLEDPAGRVVASNDDLVTGAAALGNPDSSLFHTAVADGTYTAVVRDRLNRGGPGFAYRLHVRRERPAFHLWTLPESLTVERGGSATIRLLMARDDGFDKEEVAVWTTGLVSVRSRFRPDQAWELGGDGLQMTTPEVRLEIPAPADLRCGRYRIRIFGEATRGGAGNGPVEAHAVLARGPLTNLFNFTRRPLASLDVEVVDPPPAKLKVEAMKATATVTVEGTDARGVEWFDLPDGATAKLVGAEGNRLVYDFAGKGSVRAIPGLRVAGRWVLGNPADLRF